MKVLGGESKLIPIHKILIRILRISFDIGKQRILLPEIGFYNNSLLLMVHTGIGANRSAYQGYAVFEAGLPGREICKCANQKAKMVPFFNCRAVK